ncbi:MAG: fatty acyl-AMP ligase, partial [Symploca sp. SIO2G7]|nr:fatty acyl-AMP ligase [Symploca sp. SIO2G7]
MVSRLVEQTPLQMMGQAPGTLANVLQWRALHEPSRVACQFLSADIYDLGNAIQGNCWTYADLDRRARMIGSQLRLCLSQQRVQPVILAYAPGLEFVAALFGCWYAGAIAIPVQPASRHQGEERWQHILKDTQAVGILTSQALLPQVKKAAEKLIVNRPGNSFFCFVTDDPNQKDSPTTLESESLNPDKGSDLALLQYTSG